MLILVMSTADTGPPLVASVVAGSGVSAIGGAKDSRGSAWRSAMVGGAAGESSPAAGVELMASNRAAMVSMKAF